MARLAVENLTKIFKGPRGESIRAVNDASLVVEDREFMVLVGPSGCGKSTMLRLIAGLETPTQGTIAIDGRVVNGQEPKDRDLAMVFQNFALYPHMTVRENMAFGLKLRKVPRAETDQRVNQAAELLGLTGCLDRPPQDLSGGERQRVAVGRAIVRQPKVLLFDEPLSNLDAQMRVQMRREIARLHRRLATTIIYVTHDQIEAMTLGDRIAVMQAGVIQQVAGPMTVYRQPANLFVAGFIGSPPMNVFHGVIAVRNGVTFFQEQTAAGANGGLVLVVPEKKAARLAGIAGRRIVFGLRPENVGIKSGEANPVAGVVVEAIVEGVESLGPETHLFATTGAHSFVARIGAGAGLAAEQKVALIFDMDQALFFDPATGLEIG